MLDAMGGGAALPLSLTCSLLRLSVETDQFQHGSETTGDRE